MLEELKYKKRRKALLAEQVKTSALFDRDISEAKKQAKKKEEIEEGCLTMSHNITIFIHLNFDQKWS